MKRTALRWIAAVSALAALSIHAARRPRYGGALRIETRAPENPFADAVFETLIKLDEHGDPKPWLATSWSHDAARKIWVFTPRANVVMHNGAVWSPGAIEFPDDRPIEEFSRAKYAIAVRAEDGSMIGTGPFRIAKSEPLTLAAHEAYWGGRPFLDSVEIRTGREQSDQAADFQLGRTDAIDGLLNAKRFGDAQTELIALQFDPRVPDSAREALALSVDRAAIHSVILQKVGEPAYSLLPEWLSGYAFLFATERKIVRTQAVLGFSYDTKDPVLRPVAQRIEVNAREAGIVLRAPGAEVRLVRIPITSRDPMMALEDMGDALGMPVAPAPRAYDAERAILAGYRVVPIVHLPKLWTISPRLHNWPRLADVWME